MISNFILNIILFHFSLFFCDFNYFFNDFTNIFISRNRVLIIQIKTTITVKISSKNFNISVLHFCCKNQVKWSTYWSLGQGHHL